MERIPQTVARPWKPEGARPQLPENIKLDGECLLGFTGLMAVAVPFVLTASSAIGWLIWIFFLLLLAGLWYLYNGKTVRIEAELALQPSSQEWKKSDDDFRAACKTCADKWRKTLVPVMIKVSASSKFQARASGVNLGVVSVDVFGSVWPNESIATVCFTDARGNTVSLNYPISLCKLKHSGDGKQYAQFPLIEFGPDDKSSTIWTSTRDLADARFGSPILFSPDFPD